MSMLKNIVFNDKEYKFKVSAGTEILFKRFWGVDLDVEFKKTIAGFGDDVPEVIKHDLNNLMTTVQEIQSMDNSDPEKIRRGLDIWQKCGDLLTMKQKRTEFCKKFAYIAALEAAHDPEDIDQYLTNAKFTAWLMGIDNEFFTQKGDEILSMYFGNFAHTSKPKKKDE